MIEDPDIYDAARLLIEHHGPAAAAVAASRADARMLEGDVEAALTWKCIVSAIEEIQRGRRGGERLR